MLVWCRGQPIASVILHMSVIQLLLNIFNEFYLCYKGFLTFVMSVVCFSLHHLIVHIVKMFATIALIFDQSVSKNSKSHWICLISFEWIWIAWLVPIWCWQCSSRRYHLIIVALVRSITRTVIRPGLASTLHNCLSLSNLLCCISEENPFWSLWLVTMSA